MTTRNSVRTVTFRRPFVLSGFDAEIAPGCYSVETDEELLEGLSFPAYRRVLTLLHVPATSDRPGLAYSLAVDPDELDAALQRDRDDAIDHPA